MEAKIKIAVLCFDVSDIDIITVNNRLMETLKQNIDLPEKEKLRRLKEAKGGTWSSPVASRAPATSTSETWFGR